MNLTRIVALIVAAAVLAGGAAAPGLPDGRREAAWKKRRIIMNNDGNDLLRPATSEAGPPTPEEFLAARTTPLVGSQVDAIFYSDGVFNSYTHRSTETERRGEVSGGRVDVANQLQDRGKDSLELILDFGRKHNMEIFWSMRMNDTHDSGAAYAHLLSQWKRDHPDLLMAPERKYFRYGSGRWSSVDYAKPAVRDKVFAILDDVISRYDVDGVELDFLRHPVFFKPQLEGGKATAEQCEMMTGLIRRIRARLDEKAGEAGRPLLLAARVPDSVSYCKAIGLDLEAWLSEGLLDILVGSGPYRLEPWDNWADLGHRYGVPAYACLSDSRLGGKYVPEGVDELELWRGEAWRAWMAGVDGIYTFNRFDPRDPIFRELGDPKLLESLPRDYRRVPGQTGLLKRYLKDGEKYVVPE